MNSTAPRAVAVRSQVAEHLDALGRSALIGYLPVGYPTVDGSIDAVRTMIDAGADVVELVVPYSDPVMDGPTVQRAVDAALAGGTKVGDTIRAVEQVAGRGDKDVATAAAWFDLIEDEPVVLADQGEQL